jgi:hypothetical protein
MKQFYLIAAVGIALVAACGERTPRESGTQTAPVANKAGEKRTTEPGSSASAQAERGSGTTATNSAGTTSGGQTDSVGGTSR